MKRAMGMDLSPTGSALVTLEQDSPVEAPRVISMLLLNRGKSPPKKGDEALRGMSIDNLVYVASGIGDELTKRDPQLIALEDYSGGHGPQAVYLPFIGEVAGAAKLWMRQLGLPWVEVAAATLKKFTTGTGKGKKEAMWLGAYKRWGVDQTTLGDDNNVLDAYCLARAALVLLWLGEPGERVLKADRDTLKVVRTGGSPRERGKKRKAGHDDPS